MIRSARQHSTPMLVTSLDDQRTVRRLEHVVYTRRGEAEHSEAWLQALVAECPSLLPVHEIEPGFGNLTSICMELQTPAGSVDNFFLTPEGNIVLAECKLWRNPEARREVVAQIMDYAQGMANWSYQDLENAARRANPELKSLHGLFADEGSVVGVDEAAFVDAVSRNLSLGRMLLIVLGDGIREGAEQLAGMLQSHAGFHFTLALVEMPIFRLPGSEYVVAPRILTRTVTIERGIVTVSGDSGAVRIASQPQTGSQPRAPVRKTISLEQFREELADNSPEALHQLNQFEALTGDRSIVREPATKSLVLRWYAPDGTGFSLGYINPNGRFLTDNVGWVPDSIGRLDLAHAYLEALAALTGCQIRKTPKPANWHLRDRDGDYPDAAGVLKHGDKLLAAIDQYTQALTRAIQD